MLAPRIALAIARNAHERHDPKGAYFAGDERKTVLRLAKRGLMQVTESNKAEMYAAITAAGLKSIGVAP